MQYCHTATRKSSVERVWLYDQLVAAGWSMNGMVPIEIDSVADYWGSTPQEYWTSKDWPSCHPPHSAAFVEAEFPRVLIHQNRKVEYTRNRFRFGCGTLLFDTRDWSWLRAVPRTQGCAKYISALRREAKQSTHVIAAHLFLGGDQWCRSEGILSHIFLGKGGRDRRRITTGWGLGSDRTSAMQINSLTDGLINMALLAFSRLNSGKAEISEAANNRFAITMLAGRLSDQ